MASAPASIVLLMEEASLPPLAMMGISGKRSRTFPTTAGVSLPAATLTTLAPAMILVATSSSKVTTVRTTGMSMLVEISRTSSMLVGELTTTP